MSPERVLTTAGYLTVTMSVLDAITLILEMRMAEAGASLILGGVFAAMTHHGPAIAAFLRGNR